MSLDKSAVRKPSLNGRIAVIVWAAMQDRAMRWAEVMNAPIYYVSRKPFGSSSVFLTPLRYILQAVDTWLILWRQRPELVHVTNPPFLAPLAVYLYCQITGAKYMMDTHSPALYSRRWGWTFLFQRYLAKHAYLNIVDQERFKRMFEECGARAVVLQRPPVNVLLPRPIEHLGNGIVEITVINTFAPDEPLEPIYQAARKLTDVVFYILGDKRLAPPGTFDNVPENVCFTGYLHDNEYWQRVMSSTAVMCLTTYPYSLLAGAQDGMLAGIPLIISRQPVLIEYFTKGTIFVDHTPDSIVDGIQQLRSREAELRREILDLLTEKRLLWEKNYQVINEIIRDILL